MFNKIKAILVILIFAYVGFMGWKTFSGKTLRKPSILTPGKPGGDGDLTDQENAEDLEGLTPLQQIHRELSRVDTGLFGPLKSGELNKSTQLKGLWTRSETEFREGRISESDAKTLTALITKLGGISSERQLYVDRFDQLDDMKGVSFQEGMTAEQKKRFAEKELYRQWKEWVQINRPQTQQLFEALSE